MSIENTIDEVALTLAAENGGGWVDSVLAESKLCGDPLRGELGTDIVGLMLAGC